MHVYIHLSFHAPFNPPSYAPSYAVFSVNASQSQQRDENVMWYWVGDVLLKFKSKTAIYVIIKKRLGNSRCYF